MIDMIMIMIRYIDGCVVYITDRRDIGVIRYCTLFIHTNQVFVYIDVLFVGCEFFGREVFLADQKVITFDGIFCVGGHDMISF